MSIYLQELIPQRKYDRWDYVKMLRSLLPRGIAWRIPLPDERNIELDSINSSEAFGRITISQGETIITPDGIISQEVFGLPLIREDFILSMVGIASQEAFGLLIINPETFINPNSILSSQSFGSPTIQNVYLIYDNFGCPIGSGWDSELYTEWYCTTESGYGIIQSASNVDSRAFPPVGQYLSGDFTIYGNIFRSASEGSGNNSIRIAIKNTSGTIKHYVHYYTDTLISATGGYFDPPSGPISMQFKFTRVSGVIWLYYWNGASWLREDSWTTPGSSVSESGNVFIEINGADGVNGIDKMAVIGTIV